MDVMQGGFWPARDATTEVAHAAVVPDQFGLHAMSPDRKME